MKTITVNLPNKNYSVITGTRIIAHLGICLKKLKIGNDAYIITNALIKAGAKIVTSVQDILEELPVPEKSLSPAAVPPRSPSDLSEGETLILKYLSHEPLHVDKIIKATRLETPSAIATLSLLEIKGLAKNIGGMHYIRIQMQDA